MAVPPQMTKTALRQYLKSKRYHTVSKLNSSEIKNTADALATLAFPHCVSAPVIASYMPIGSEIDPRPLAAQLVAHGARLALPRVESREAPLRFLAWAPHAPLETGLFGLEQPAADAPEVTPDLILTPLLGFDDALNRIGYGAGHYDRAFARYPAARRIGLAWCFQQCDAIPIDAWDVRLHAIATETDWIQP